MQEKMFFVEIDSLDNEDGCFASNEYFAEFFKLTKQRCSQVINGLIKKGYLKVQYEYNGKEIKKRVLNIFDRGIKYSKLGVKNPVGGIKDMRKGYQEKFTDNNTGSNPSNNTVKKEKFQKPTYKQIEEYCNEKHYTIDIQAFIDFYDSKGWMVGKNKMVSWQGSVGGWWRRDKDKKGSKEPRDLNYMIEMEKEMRETHK